MSGHTRIQARVAAAAVVGAGALVLIAELVGSARAEGIPATETLAYSGMLLEGSVPVSGMRNIGITLWDAPSGGTDPVCATPSGPRALETGHFRIVLADSCTTAVQRNPDLWVQVELDGAPLSPRSRISAVPYAVEAANGVPPGTIVAFGGEVIPPGWELCNGRVVDGDDPRYASLFAAIGTTWGDGRDLDPTTFALPDLGGTFLRGAHGAGRDPDGDRAPGSRQAGAFESHTHGVSDPGHIHPVGGGINLQEAGGGSRQEMTWDSRFRDDPSDILHTSGGATTGVTVQSTGGPETRPPNVAVNYIVKL